MTGNTTVFYLLYYAMVFLGNTSYFLKEIYGLMNKEGVKEFMPPVGEKPITLEDVKGVGEAKDVCPSCIDLYTTDRKKN